MRSKRFMSTASHRVFARSLAVCLGLGLVAPASILRLSQATSAEGKTKNLKAQLAKLELANALIIDGAEPEAGFVKAARNIPNIDVLPVQGINVYDVLRRDTLVLTKSAVEALGARFS